MKPSELGATLTALIPTRQPVFIKGAPGTGKSSIVWQAASACWNGQTAASTVGGLPDVDWFVTIRATDRDPVDLRGIPYQQDGYTLWAKPDLLASLKDGGGVICVLSARLHEVVAEGGVDWRSTLRREGDRCGGTGGWEQGRAWRK